MSEGSSSIDKVYVLEQILALSDSTVQSDEDKLIERYYLIYHMTHSCSGIFLWDISMIDELANFLYQNHILTVASKILFEDHTDRLKVFGEDFSLFDLCVFKYFLSKCLSARSCFCLQPNCWQYCGKANFNCSTRRNLSTSHSDY